MKMIWGLITAALVFASGCATTSISTLPPGAVKVGGGLAIEWRSSSDGTVILYDAISKRMVTTRSIGSSEMFLFPNSENDEEILEAFYPGTGEASKARFELFFVPGVEQ